MEISIAIAGKIAEYLVDPVKRQLGYLIWYRKNVEELKKKTEKLQEERGSLKRSVDNARRNGEEIEIKVKNWLAEVDQIIENVKCFQDDESHTRAGCNSWTCPNLWSRHQLSRKAKKMTDGVTQIHEEGKFDKISHRNFPQWMETAPPAAGYQELDSRILILNDIMEALRYPTINMVGIYGLAGVGKTTLVQELAKKAKEDKLFDVVAMAVVSQKMEIDKIQKHIADMLGLKFEEESEFIRAGRLRDRIKQENNILVILDDLWGMLDLVKIGIPFDNDYKGCKIVLTSRNQVVLSNQMNTQKDFGLGVMPKEEAWKLFKKMAELDGSDESTEILLVASQVAEECAGLPVAIVTVARALKKKNLIEWRDALRQLKNPKHRNITGMRDKVDASIKFSYDHLENDELKSIFLLCATMDNDASDVDLLKYCVGLGIFKGTYKIEEARDRLHTSLLKLKASCLLLDSTYSDRFNMHDVVRDVALSLSSAIQHAFTVRYDKLYEWPDMSDLENCSMITLDFSDICELPEMIDCPTVKFFRLYSNDRSMVISEKFFEGLSGLRVLDLTEMHLCTLPSSIRSLRNLRTLCLDCGVLEDIALIGELTGLKILSLLRSDIKQLPCEIKQLIQLQFLDLSECSKLEVIPSGVFSCLKKLEELYMSNSFMRWKDEGSFGSSNNASLSELKELPRLNNIEICIRDASMLPVELFSEKLEKYKILIGDVWNWSGEYSTMRTLKLKVTGSLHSEQAGIKTLLRNVEDLYLDELNVQNVLYQLNSEGFPCLKHLLIQNNAEIQRIINFMEWYPPHEAFPNLESLVLHNLLSLEKICYGQMKTSSFGKLKVIKVKNCNLLKNLFSTSMVRNLSKLSEIEVVQCNSMEEIFMMDTEENDINVDFDKVEFPQLHSLTLQHLPTLIVFGFENKTSPTIQTSPVGTSTNMVKELSYCMPLFADKVSFPNLETLKLTSINVEKIWHNQPSVHFCIQNLTTLIVEDCGKLKHLFSFSVARCLVKLKHLEISKCHIMEDIVFSEGRTSYRHSNDEVLFPKLETLMISHMDYLKMIWNDRLAVQYFCKVNTIEIKHCKKLVTVFTPKMLMNTKNLETLTISDCSSLNEIFGMRTQMRGAIDIRLKKLTLHRLSELKHIWNGDPREIFNFHNLQVVYVTECQKLKHIFPTSVAKGLPMLQVLDLRTCDVTEIIAKEDEANTKIPSFVFPKLTTMTFVGLFELTSFYPGKHRLECPMLNNLEIMNCDLIDPLGSESTDSGGIYGEDRHDAVIRQPLFSIQEVIPLLEILTLNSKDTMRIWNGQFPADLFRRLKDLRLYHFNSEDDTFPYWLLVRISTLKTLTVKFSGFKELFPCNRRTALEQQIGMPVRLTNLKLWAMPVLQRISKEGFNIDLVLEKLESLEVWECASLVNLVHSSVSLNHLRYLEVKKCDKMTTLMSSSTVKSLSQLITLKIKDCKMVEEIISSDTEEYDEIEFGQLRVLELQFLPKLASFCSFNCGFKFPFLEEVSVKGCPRLKTFSKGVSSTPKLQRVQVEGTADEWHWEGALNATIETLFTNMAALRSFEHLDLYEFPELHGIWHHQLPTGSFCNLKSLAVENCDFLTVVISLKLLRLLYNLEELTVQCCNRAEAIFDLEGINDQEWRGMETTRLQKLTLKELPLLMDIWNKNPQNFYSFQNLQAINIVECLALKYLFPVSIAKGLEKLETFLVDYCGLEEIVAKDEESTSAINFVFPRLTSISLGSLFHVKYFYPGAHTIEWPILKNIDVISCDMMEIFGTEIKDFPGTHPEDQQIACQQPLFSIEKVIPIVEQLSLDSRILTKISQGQISTDFFFNVNLLRIQSFEYENAIFPYWFLQKVPKLEKFAAKFSSFKQIFQSIRSLGDQRSETTIRLKEVFLWSLPKLVTICEPGYELDPILEFLEELKVWECSSLPYLVPPLVCFKHLVFLDVSKCDGMMFLMTSSTARNLTQLTELRVKECKLMEAIVCREVVHQEEEIVLKRLKFVDLVNLPNLSAFCTSNGALRLPLLESVLLNHCPRMKMFSGGPLTTSKLQKIKVEESRDECYWDGSLNATVEKLYTDMVAFRRMVNLNMSEFPELRGVWFISSQNGFFSNLKTLVIEDCEIPPIVIGSKLQSLLVNLEELEVKNCPTVRSVFGLEEVETNITNFVIESRLKKLTLSHLSELSLIWNGDPKTMVSFKNLEKISVSECQSLKNLFPLSVAKDLGKLEELEIESSGIEEIVAGEELELEVNFVFPSVRYLKIWLLVRLNNFYPGKYTIEWPVLRDLDIYICSNINVFSSEILTSHESNWQGEVQNQRPLFILEKTIPNIEELSVNCKEDMMKWLNRCPVDFFSGLKFLRIQFVDDEENGFPYWFLQCAQNLDNLVVKFCSFKEIFFGERNGEAEIQIRDHTKLKNLWLWGCSKLDYIAKEGFELDHVLEKVENLYVWECSLLTKLVPSSVNFTHLTSLEVKQCDGMVYMITSSTARSLVQLTTLKIIDCALIREIVATDDHQDEIEFNQLKTLELLQLPCLSAFCSTSACFKFPNLENVTVKVCRVMTTFAVDTPIAPMLQKVQVEEETEGGWCWEGDLNTTIAKLFTDTLQADFDAYAQSLYFSTMVPSQDAPDAGECSSNLQADFQAFAESLYFSTLVPSQDAPDAAEYYSDEGDTY